MQHHLKRCRHFLGLIFASTLIGIVASSLKEKGRALIDFFEAATQTVIAILRWFLWYIYCFLVSFCTIYHACIVI